MVSRELLGEVLNLEIYHCKKVAQTSIVRYKFNAIGEVRDSSINIYELAHKCKEWAYRQKIGKTGSYYNGCGRSQQHLMHEINIITKYYHHEYLATIDNGKDLNCRLDFYGLTAKHNSSVKEFEYKAQTVEEICFYAHTEPEAVFKACQWVLENR